MTNGRHVERDIPGRFLSGQSGVPHTAAVCNDIDFDVADRHEQTGAGCGGAVDRWCGWSALEDGKVTEHRPEVNVGSAASDKHQYYRHLVYVYEYVVYCQSGVGCNLN